MNFALLNVASNVCYMSLFIFH